MNNIASFSPFESPKGLHTNILFPNTSRYLATFRATMHLEAWGQDGYGLSVI